MDGFFYAIIYHLPPQYIRSFSNKKAHFYLSLNKNMKKIITILLINSFLHACISAQSMYFPPAIGTIWETLTPQSLGWCTQNIDSLNRFLEEKNSKAFIVLKNGRIVMEKYFGTFTQDSAWYWASAGKTMTAFLTGIAQQDGLFKINDISSKYLGVGWSSAPTAKEQLITIKNHLTMTTGLDENIQNENCNVPSCFVYKADAGTRWAYHTAAYYLIEDMIEKTSGMNYTQYTSQKLQSKTGIAGLWLNHVFFSKPRTMARFGLLLLNKGVWNQNIILNDSTYFKEMTNASQNINKSYGYLTWLNGKGSYILPQSQFVFTGNIVPNAPADLYAALGKNDQKIYVVPSQNLVVIRMGDASGTSLYALSNFDNELWKRLAAVTCASTPTTELIDHEAFTIYPNPTSDILNVQFKNPVTHFTITLYNANGQVLKSIKNNTSIDISELAKGFYYLEASDTEGGQSGFKKFIKN